MSIVLLFYLVQQFFCLVFVGNSMLDFNKRMTKFHHPAIPQKLSFAVNF